MWVQEGYDCKDSDDAVANSSLFSGIYSFSKPKQSISTIGIPMKSRPKKPISPSQFLENMNNDKNNNGDTITVPPFDINIDLKDMMEPEFDETECADFSDLAIIGKKLEVCSIDISDHEQDTKEMEIDTNMDLDDTSKEQKEDSYVSAKFDGLDIQRWDEWNECINFSQTNDGLLIIELYPSIFGASDIMYPFIHGLIEGLHKKQNNKIKFVRLSTNTMKQIDGIKQVIFNDTNYALSALSTYIFIKNGIKIDEIKGIKLREFEDLINKYSKQCVINYVCPPIIKYKSIVSNKENENVENIMNLIKNTDTKYASH